MSRLHKKHGNALKSMEKMTFVNFNLACDCTYKKTKQVPVYQVFFVVLYHIN